jgi:hypothetical protein
MDTQACKARIENLITMEEVFHTCEELPLPEQLKKLAEWVDTHLSAADQAWIDQPWPQVLARSLARSIEEPPDESALSVERGQPTMRGMP